MKKFFLMIAALVAVYAVSAQPAGYVWPCYHVVTVDASYYNGYIYSNGSTIHFVIPGAAAPLTISADGLVQGVTEPYVDNSFFTVPTVSLLNSFDLTVQPQTTNGSMIRSVDVTVKDNTGKNFYIKIHQNPYYLEHDH